MRNSMLIAVVIIAGCNTSPEENAYSHLTVENTTEARVEAYLKSYATYPDSIVVEHCSGMRTSKGTTTTDAFCLYRGRDRHGSRVRIGNAFFFHEDGSITQL